MKTRASVLRKAAQLIDAGGWLDPESDELAQDANGKPVDLATGRGVKFGMYGALWTALGPMIHCGKPRCPGICTCEIYSSGLKMHLVEKYLDRFTKSLGSLPGIGGFNPFICTSYLYWESQVARTKRDVIRFFRAAAKGNDPSKKDIQRGMTAHDLAKRLLELPDKPVTIVKPKGEQYTSKFIVHPGGPWETFGQIRIQVERADERAEAR